MTERTSWDDIKASRPDSPAGQRGRTKRRAARSVSRSRSAPCAKKKGLSQRGRRACRHHPVRHRPARSRQRLSQPLDPRQDRGRPRRRGQPHHRGHGRARPGGRGRPTLSISTTATRLDLSTAHPLPGRRWGGTRGSAGLRHLRSVAGIASVRNALRTSAAMNDGSLPTSSHHQVSWPPGIRLPILAHHSNVPAWRFGFGFTPMSGRCS